MPLTSAAILILSVAVIAWTLLRRRVRGNTGRPFRRRLSELPPTRIHRTARKPPWIHRAVIHLASRRDKPSCRVVTEDFNRLHIDSRWTVGRTFVAGVLKANARAIAEERRMLKSRKPRCLPNHLVWAMDISFIQGIPVAGIIDHGSRYVLRLAPIPDKSSVQLLRVLLAAIDAAGQAPKFLRTDNEACFVSRVFRFGLWILGIRHQRTDVASPWQNGRIERFFGTLKEKLAQVVIDHRHLAENLELLRFWYNETRTHQNLGGKTPREVLDGSRSRGTAYWFEAWGGVLQGYLFKPS